MKRIQTVWLFLLISILSYTQNTNSISMYEGYRVGSVVFTFTTPIEDATLLNNYLKQVTEQFAISAGMQYGSVMASYYTARLNLLNFVSNASLSVLPSGENQVSLFISIQLSATTTIPKSKINLRNTNLLPVLYNSNRFYLTTRAAASEMIYTNHNTWFGQPTPMTDGNPLANSPSGSSWSAWLEGFSSVGLYGVVQVIPAINLHIYGGASYMVSFSAGNELFTQDARIYANVEDAFIGIIGGNTTADGHVYKYNITYGRKSFTLADGWLLINTSMNGNYRAALQLNPRWAADEVLSFGGQFDRFTLQFFSVRPNELAILNSKTNILGTNLEVNNGKYGTIGLSYLTVPESQFTYYMPTGTTYQRKGLEIYNLRYYRVGTAHDIGLLLKTEVGYQRNRNFDMSSLAYYGEVGWKFNQVKGAPTISYRYAHFPGDNPETSSYNRWDALYTGGNGEQWVQGSIMYKLVQNSNENTHRIQAVYNPARKFQLVGQFWLFYADQLINIGGNPALSVLGSKFYGTEYNFTGKYFYSKNWYFHLNLAYATPGEAIRNNVSDTKHWFSAMLFARYSF